MDAQTLVTYEADAVHHTTYQRSLTPGPVHRLATAFFHPGQPAADAGCGSWRDTAWLVGPGFPTVGYEPAVPMREQALAVFPKLDVRAATLPTSPASPTAASSLPSNPAAWSYSWKGVPAGHSIPR